MGLVLFSGVALPGQRCRRVVFAYGPLDMLQERGAKFVSASAGGGLLGGGAVDGR